YFAHRYTVPMDRIYLGNPGNPRLSGYKLTLIFGNLVPNGVNNTHSGDGFSFGHITLVIFWVRPFFNLHFSPGIQEIIDYKDFSGLFGAMFGNIIGHYFYGFEYFLAFL